MNRQRLVGRSSALALIISGLTFVSAGPAAAQSISDVVVTGLKQTAPYDAPTKTPLDVVEPTSLLTQHYIQNNVPLSANYDQVIMIAPSVNTVSPNGPGLMEDQSVTIRGFQDGEYNMTIDGIAWGDSNDFTHHTTSYVMSHDLGAVVVDRGPGTASTLGYATFGGTVSLLTKDPLDRQTIEGYGSIGSFSTVLGGAEIDTGTISSLGGGKGLIDAEHLESSGALSYMGQNRTNVFAKWVQPLNDRTTLTLVAMYNHIHQYVGVGATNAQYAQFGYNYGLNADPSSQDYFGYNYDQIKTDMIYAALKSDLGNGWLLDNKLYTYSYWHHGFNGEDPNGETPNGTFYSPTDVPGQQMRMIYTSVGDIFRLSKDIGWAVGKVGFWYDHQDNWRSQWEVDDTLGTGVLNPPDSSSVDRMMRNTLDTFEPYIEADIKPLPGLTLTPGLKYMLFDRGTNSAVDQKTKQPLNYSKTYDALAPSIEANYKVNDNFAVYAQAAKGFLAPNMNVFYTKDPTQTTTLNPQTTWNYQAGASYSSSRLTISGDYYYIDFSNKIASRNIAGITVFYNQGGVIYKGVEGEATLKLIDGFDLYGNGSLNSAKIKGTNQTIAMAPKTTAAIGLIYDANRVTASLLAKYVGQRYGDDPELYSLPGYTTAQLGLGYTFPRAEGRPAIKVTGLIDNLFDKRGNMMLAGYTGQDGTPLYWNIVPRSYTLEVSVAF